MLVVASELGAPSAIISWLKPVILTGVKGWADTSPEKNKNNNERAKACKSLTLFLWK
jgi:hypothetical protein